jgi:hypothetical protein
MRRFLSLLTLVPLLFCCSARADIAVYRSMVVVKEIQAELSGTKRTAGFEIVDLSTGDSVTINLRKTGNVKQFFTGTTTPHMLTTVVDSRTSKPKEYTVLADAFRGQSQEVDSVQSRVLKGKKVPVVIRGADPTNVPKVLAGNQVAVFADAALFEAAVVLRMDVTTTKAVNDASETLADAAARVKAQLVAQGYQAGDL